VAGVLVGRHIVSYAFARGNILISQKNGSNLFFFEYEFVQCELITPQSVSTKLIVSHDYYCIKKYPSYSLVLFRHFLSRLSMQRVWSSCYAYF